MGWIPKDDRWLADRVSRSGRQSTSPTTIDDNQDTSSEYGITIFILKCPRGECRSINVERYKTFAWEGKKRKKYYKCNDCDHRFRVTEIDKE